MNTRDKAAEAVMASLAADALSLGAHWVYNTRVIDKKFGTVDRFHKPLTSFHPGRQAGDFTHYGDQVMWLLESLAASGRFDEREHIERWRKKFKNYDGYFDKATRATLENLEAKADPLAAGSTSDDLSAAVLIAPLVYRYRDDPTTLAAAARQRAALTHNRPEVVDAAEFLARTAWHVLQGDRPVAALSRVQESYFARSPFREWIDDGLASRDADTRTAISDFGQMCAVEVGFPGVIHLIARYEDDLRRGLIANVMAGGDSAARGLAVGAILGAQGMPHALPDEWRNGLKQGERIRQLLARIDEKAAS